MRSIYNVKNGQNTVLRGLLAEEFARYSLIQKFPLLILRPAKLLDFLVEDKVISDHFDFLQKYQQTMDYIGFGPINQPLDEQTTPRDIILNYFYSQDGLTKYIDSSSPSFQIKGYIIEVKSRSGVNYWKSFDYTFSEKQVKMFDESRKLNFGIILCGVTFEKDWNLGIIFTDQRGKILPPDFILKG
ncbi:MAG: hypothetical protein ACW99Q_26900 [Candidatus Kariarchaeaceae archaeon]